MILFANGMQTEVVPAIQLALAPVFLLTGIAGILNVMANRFSRIVDRGRNLTENSPLGITLPAQKLALEIRSLERRRYFTSVAITSCTFAALLVCLVIALLFLEVLLQLPMKWLEGVLFTSSTVALVIGLTYFLREVHLSTRTIRIEIATSTEAQTVAKVIPRPESPE